MRHIPLAASSASLPLSMASKIPTNDSSVRVRLTKPQIDILKPSLRQLASSYREHLKRGHSPFTYPFQIYPPTKDFDRGTFNHDCMEKIIELGKALSTKRDKGRWMEMDAVELRAAAFAVRSHLDFVRLLRRQQRRESLAEKARLHIDDKSYAQLKAKSQRVISLLERHMKRANRAAIKSIGIRQHDVLVVIWKAHLRWMRLHIAYYKPWGRSAHGRRKRQQRHLDELMEMAKLAVRGEGHRRPSRKKLRHLMRLYARYSRSGRRGYWTVESLLENKDTYRAQWNMAQFVIKRSKPKEPSRQ